MRMAVQVWNPNLPPAYKRQSERFEEWYAVYPNISGQF